MACLGEHERLRLRTLTACPRHLFCSRCKDVSRMLMAKTSIYQFVKEKLITHGVKNTNDGLVTLTDQKLFSLFVDLERAKRNNSFDAVQSASLDIEKYLISLKKRQLLAFVYLYLRFSDLTPERTELDELLPDGKIRKSSVFSNKLTDEEMLIGLWAKVKYDQLGERLLRIVYAGS